MSLNKDQRNALIDAVNQSALEPDQKSSLMGLLNEKKRYGLVWEDKPEYAKERMKNELPVLVDVPERYVEGASPDSPHHVLIEGDNYNALTALQYTHAGKVDVIYIDPPYNTGNKDFSYQDTFKDEPEFIDREHRFRHSTWLSFMEKRLKLAKALLKETGVIFISIDDNEQAQLKLLCDEIFGEGNFVDNIIWEKNYAPRNDAKYFSASHDFIVVYHKGAWERKLELRTETQNKPYKLDDKDGRGLYRTDNVLVKAFSVAAVYPVKSPHTGIEYYPPKGSCWRYSRETFERMILENRIYWGKDGKGAPQAKRYLNEVQQGSVPQTIWFYKDVGHTQDGKNELKDFELTSRVFETPKPSQLLKKIINYCVNQNSLILDFFAGSGTTLHATMALNAEDGGKRQCILVTNNENQICEQVTYERNKRVIQGYTNSKGQTVDGLKDNHLHYFKVGFVDREKTMRNKKQMSQKSGALLQLKENCFVANTVLSGEGYHVFEHQDFLLYWVVDPNSIPDVVASIEKSEKRCKVYVHSPDNDPFSADFEEVMDQVELFAIPEAIYRAYKNSLPEMSHD